MSSVAQPNKNKHKDRIWIPILLAISICLLLWTGGMLFTHWYAKSYFIVKDTAESTEALFGDSFGAVNALISAFAFAGVIVSMYFQRKDLELQRSSLEMQREELVRNTDELSLQREEFQTQNKTMMLQRFESTFFNMLSMQQELVNNIKFSYTETRGSLLRGNREEKHFTIIGRQVFELLYEQSLKQEIEENGINGFYQTESLHLFDHYFRHLYRIIKFVDETILLECKAERYSYITILRATLSRYELVFLFYNELNFPNFKKLIEEYSLFDNLNKNSLINNESIPINTQLEFYNESAYNPHVKGYNNQ
jgi:hypothetical protein